LLLYARTLVFHTPSSSDVVSLGGATIVLTTGHIALKVDPHIQYSIRAHLLGQKAPSGWPACFTSATSRSGCLYRRTWQARYL